MNLDILIKNCTIITMDQDRRIVYDGFLGIKNQEIIFIEKALPNDVHAVKVIDAKGHVGLPGFIDTHAHAGHGLTKSLGEGGVQGGWDNLMEHIYYRCTTPDFWYVEAKLSGLERLLFGVTTGVSMLGSAPRYDDLRYAEAHVNGMFEVGVRDILGIGTPNPPFPKTFRHWDDDQPGIERVLCHETSFGTTWQAVKRFNNTNQGLTYCYPSPSGIGYREGLTHEALKQQARAMKGIAQEFGTPLHGHSYAGDIKYAYEHLNVLGPDVFTAHVTGVSDEEISILADTGTHVCSGPSTTAFIEARCPIIKMLDAGVNVTLCTDASAPDRTYDLLDKLRVALRLHRSYHNDSSLLPPGKLLEMITVDAARAIGLDHIIGSLETGKKADVVLIDFKKPHLYPLWMEPVRVVNQASGQDVDTVIVNGKVLMENRLVSHTNVDMVLQRAQEEALKMIIRADAHDALKLPNNFWKHTRY